MRIKGGIVLRFSYLCFTNKIISNEKQNKITNSSQYKVNEPVVGYKKMVAKESLVPEGYTPSEEFWRQQKEKTIEFCKKSGIL